MVARACPGQGYRVWKSMGETREHTGNKRCASSCSIPESHVEKLQRDHPDPNAIPLGMDGVLAHDFDMIDAFIARHHLDPVIAAEAMAMDSGLLARMLVDMNVPRADLVRLARGCTPASSPMWWGG